MGLTVWMAEMLHGGKQSLSGGRLLPQPVRGGSERVTACGGGGGGIEEAAAAVPPQLRRAGHGVGPQPTPCNPAIEGADSTACNHKADCPLQSSSSSPGTSSPPFHLLLGPFTSHFNDYNVQASVTNL